MPQTVVVLRPFVFTFPPKEKRQKLATELKITPDKDPVTKDWVPTPRELPDEVVTHPWIQEHYADGCIERPEKTQERMNAIESKQADDRKAAARIIAEAEAALARAGRSTEIKQGREADVDRDLNTPVNELQAKQGQDIDQPIGTPKDPAKTGRGK